jgi:hypothetical protein
MSRSVVGRKRLFMAAALLLAILIPAQSYAQGSATVRSLIFPGAGQAHKGHYKKAALFAGLAIVSAAGAVVSGVHYNQAVDRYHSEKRTYLHYQNELDAGTIVSVDDMNSTYDSMQRAFDQADSRLVWRNTFLTALVTTYALNLVDVILSKPHEVDTARYSVEADDERVLVTARIRF